MKHSSKGFRYQIHASVLCQRLGPYWFNSRICRTPNENSSIGAKNRWKIGWYNFRARTITLESVCWRRSKPQGVWGGASLNISWRDYHREIVETRVLGHKQWSWIWDLIARNDHGTENRGKGSENILGLEISCGPSEGGARGQRCGNAGVFELGQVVTIGF